MPSMKTVNHRRGGIYTSFKQPGISPNLRTGLTGHATLFNQWEGALVFIKTSTQWSKIVGVFKYSGPIAKSVASLAWLARFDKSKLVPCVNSRRECIKICWGRTKQVWYHLLTSAGKNQRISHYNKNKKQFKFIHFSCCCCSCSCLYLCVCVCVCVEFQPRLSVFSE